MGLRVTLRPKSSSQQPLILCDSPDPLPTFNIRLNHTRINDVVALYDAAYAVGYDSKNRRNLFGFEVTRVKDAEGNAFSGPADALAYALNLTRILPAESVAEIYISDGISNFTCYMQNTLTDRADLGRVNGVKLGYAFFLNGGEITTSL